MIILTLVILTVLYAFVAQPVLAFGFTDWSFLCLIWGAGLMFISIKVMIERGGSAVKQSFVGWIVFKLFGDRIRMPEQPAVTNTVVPIRYKVLAWTGLLLIVLAVLNSVVLPILLSNPLMFSSSYRALIGNVEESNL